MTKTVLVVAAHTDDETLGCAGTIAKHIASGDDVHLLFMTDGVGSRIVSSDEADARLKAAHKAAEILGVKSFSNRNFPDNRMDSVPLLDVVKEVEAKIKELHPKVIYTHHIGDLNVDHQVTSKAVITACRPQPGCPVKEIYSYEVLSSTEWASPHISPFVPTMFVDITATFDRKIQALRAYQVEMRDHPHSRSYENVAALASYRGCSVGVKYAEAFETIRRLS